jgi:hypothetical protein
MVTGEKGRPRWARYQIAVAVLAGLVGVALFIVQGIDNAVWGVDLDFGMLPWGLVVLSSYVIFNISLPTLLGPTKKDDEA